MEIMRFLTNRTLHQVLLGRQNQRGWDGARECNLHGGDEKCIQNFGDETWREGTTRKI